MRNSIDLHFHRSTNDCHQEINYSNIHCIQEFASHRARMTRDEGRTHQWLWSRSMHLAQLDPWSRETWNQTARHNPLARCLRLDSRAPFPLRLQVWCLHLESKDRRGCLNTKAVQFGLSHIMYWGTCYAEMIDFLIWKGKWSSFMFIPSPVFACFQALFCGVTEAISWGICRSQRAASFGFPAFTNAWLKQMASRWTSCLQYTYYIITWYNPIVVK